MAFVFSFNLTHSVELISRSEVNPGVKEVLVWIKNCWVLYQTLSLSSILLITEADVRPEQEIRSFQDTQPTLALSHTHTHSCLSFSLEETGLLSSPCL